MSRRDSRKLAGGANHRVRGNNIASPGRGRRKSRDATPSPLPGLVVSCIRDPVVATTG